MIWIEILGGVGLLFVLLLALIFSPEIYRAIKGKGLEE